MIALILFGILVGVVAARFVPIPSSTVTPTPTPEITTTPETINELGAIIDETADWQSYGSDKLQLFFKLPNNWTNYSTKDFTPQPFTYTEDSLFLGPKESAAKPPQIMQITAYRLTEYIEQEIYSPENCTTTNVLVGINQVTATHTLCKGSIVETKGTTRVKNSRYIFIIDELVGTAEDHRLFDKILSTFKFPPGATSSFICPTSDYVDCMPSTDQTPKPQCEAAFLTWAEANCPGFKGAAL